MSAVGSDIFTGQSAAQLLRQAEVDVLGMRLQGGAVSRIYSVDMAFHEQGLNYGGVQESRNRVLKKLLRSVLTIRFVFGPLPLRVVFASPRVGRPYVAALEEGMRALEEFLTTERIVCETSLIVNEHFREIVFDPVLAVATDIADTSELFLRSYQLINSFGSPKRAAEPSSITERGFSEPAGTLAFKFDPGPQDRFKAELLRTKSADMTIHYQNGHVERRVWNALHFQESSNLLGNLRSRPEFRPGEWQRRGISSVALSIASEGDDTGLSEDSTRLSLQRG